MKAALIGDVHANLPALEAVLDHARTQGAEAVWNIGDWVGYGAFPEEVVRRLRREATASIVGNYDRKVLEFPERAEQWQRTKRPEKYVAFRWAYENLSPDSRDYLGSLPHEQRLEVAGHDILLVHGSPAAIDESLYRDTNEARLRELAALARADIVVLGHTHQPFVRRVSGCRFINTGSVGRQDDGDPRASYALLELRPDAVDARHFRVDYDVERAVAAVRRHELPDAFAEMLRRGRKLTWVLKRRQAG